MINKRKIGGILLAVLCAGMLSGCTEPNPPATKALFEERKRCLSEEVVTAYMEEKYHDDFTWKSTGRGEGETTHATGTFALHPDYLLDIYWENGEYQEYYWSYLIKEDTQSQYLDGVFKDKLLVEKFCLSNNSGKYTPKEFTEKTTFDEATAFFLETGSYIGLTGNVYIVNSGQTAEEMDQLCLEVLNELSETFEWVSVTINGWDQKMYLFSSEADGVIKVESK